MRGGWKSLVRVAPEEGALAATLPPPLLLPLTPLSVSDLTLETVGA